jgi:3-hydroxyacyl-CoA dehydrogenase
MQRIAVVGAGVVGSSWSLVFARAGFEVAVWDVQPASAVQAREFVRSALADLAAAGVAPAEPADTIAARVKPTERLEDALDGVDYVQESAPERVETKIELYKSLDRMARRETILASSTSGLPASAFTTGLIHRERCLVVHPINPPHLIPLVEIVPAPWTDPEVVDRSSALMREAGQSPIRLSREINGFVVNRLQGAVLAEAFRLVEDGIVDADEVDRAVSEGLGLRWCFMGPFETIDLNAKTGIAEYCRNLGPMYHQLALELADPRTWSPALVKKIEDELRERTAAEAIPSRQRWRDKYLAMLGAFKRQRT